jgi:hypothetical protein
MVTNVAQIKMTESRAKTLADAIALARSSRDMFALLSDLWTMAYLVGREGEWSPAGAIFHPITHGAVGPPRDDGPLTPDEAETLLYRRHMTASAGR